MEVYEIEIQAPATEKTLVSRIVAFGLFMGFVDNRKTQSITRCILEQSLSPEHVRQPRVYF